MDRDNKTKEKRRLFKAVEVDYGWRKTPNV